MRKKSEKDQREAIPEPPQSFPCLETNRLLLRELTLADAPAILRNYSDVEVTRWFFDQPFSELGQAQGLIRRFVRKYQTGKGITWGICLRSEKQVIGTCGYEWYKTGGSGEIGFDLARPWWGQGLMHEALEAVIVFGFEKLELCRIEADTYQNNTRSIALLERLGFQLDQTMVDSYMYVIRKEKWNR